MGYLLLLWLRYNKPILILILFLNIFLLVFPVSWLIRFLLKNLWEVSFYDLKPKTINLISVGIPALYYVAQFFIFPFPPLQFIVIFLALLLCYTIFQRRDQKKLQIPYIHVVTVLILLGLLGILLAYVN